jgi:hypothetical protein
MHTAICLTVRVISECEERCGVTIGLKPDVAALTAIAAIRAALGYMGLTPKSDAACTAVATPDIDLRFVYKTTH